MAHCPADYRPITVLPVVYRLWSSLRTCQTLQLLSPHLPDDILGFIPSCETSQVWLILQSWIEVNQMDGFPLCGVSSDLQKAFNNIGRDQVQMIAEHLQLPSEVRIPWAAFLGSLTRRFDIRGSLSTAVTSDRGLPEGCPLSIIGMIMVNWCHSIYI